MTLVDFHQRLEEFLYSAPLGVAGRLLIYSEEVQSPSGRGTFLLCMHTASPEETARATQVALESIPEDFMKKLYQAGYGFGGKQI